MRRLQRHRSIVVLGLMLALLGAAHRPAEASHDGRVVVGYVAGQFYVIGPDIAATAVRENTGVVTAPLGWFEFTALDGDAVLTIDDDAAPAAVSVVVARGGVFERHCVLDHGSLHIGDLTAGERVSVWIEGPRWIYGACGPHGGGTVGIATVVR